MRWLVIWLAAAVAGAQTFEVEPSSVRQGETLRVKSSGDAEAARMNGRRSRVRECHWSRQRLCGHAAADRLRPWDELCGFSDAEWAAGVAEMTAILQRRASSLSMITYSELSKEMSTVTGGYHDPAMDNMLLEVSRNEASQGRGLLSVIVVHKHGDMEPGNGFYGLAESMGLDVSDRTACWIRELHRVHGYWSCAHRASGLLLTPYSEI